MPKHKHSRKESKQATRRSSRARRDRSATLNPETIPVDEIFEERVSVPEPVVKKQVNPNQLSQPISFGFSPESAKLVDQAQMNDEVKDFKLDTQEVPIA